MFIELCIYIFILVLHSMSICWLEEIAMTKESEHNIQTNGVCSVFM